MGVILKSVIYLIQVTITNFFNWLSSPIFDWLDENLPQFNTYFSQIESFLTNYLFKGFQFIKMCVLNLTGITQATWRVFALGLGFLLYLNVVFYFARFVYNIWRTYQGTNNGK